MTARVSLQEQATRSIARLEQLPERRQAELRAWARRILKKETPIRRVSEVRDCGGW